MLFFQSWSAPPVEQPVIQSHYLQLLSSASVQNLSDKQQFAWAISEPAMSIWSIACLIPVERYEGVDSTIWTQFTAAGD